MISLLIALAGLLLIEQNEVRYTDFKSYIAMYSKNVFYFNRIWNMVGDCDDTMYIIKKQ